MKMQQIDIDFKPYEHFLGPIVEERSLAELGQTVGPLCHENDVSALLYIAERTTGTIVELGCNRGVTTKVIALRFPQRRICAVDWTDNPDTNSDTLNRERPIIICERCVSLSNVKRMNISTREFEYPEDTGFIFIDADHTYVGVKTDTERALELRKRKEGLIIAWHDYAAQCYDQVTLYLDELVELGMPIRHVKNTMVAVLGL